MGLNRLRPFVLIGWIRREKRVVSNHRPFARTLSFLDGVRETVSAGFAAEEEGR